MVVQWINRIYHRSPIQTENSQNKCKRILPQTKFTEVPALSIDPRVGISRSTSETEKSQNKGKLIMPETRFTEVPALSVDPRVGISRSASETDVYFSYL